MIKSKRPNTSRFHQQQLKVWIPIINTFIFNIPFFVFGILFVIIGTILVLYTYQITQINVDYTNCIDDDGEKCSDQLTLNNYTWHFKSCQCTLNLTIPQSLTSPVYIYYGLTSVFQNYRRYVASRDDKQTRGLLVTKKLNSDCEPYRFENVERKIGFAPCGSIANSLFNDTFQLEYTPKNGTPAIIRWTSKGISWWADRHYRFGQPANWNDTVKPINWKISAKERCNTSYSGDEELLVWLRTAPFSTFKKLHRIINLAQFHGNTRLPGGDYLLRINYSYPVVKFNGTKTFIISTTNLLGGKNPAIGYIYMLVGTVYILLGITCLFVNNIVTRRREEMKDDVLLDSALV